jgi:LPS export ABC transporter protein LptC
MLNKFIFTAVVTLLAFASCSTKKEFVPDPYLGPLMTVYHMETLYTDSSRLKIRVQAPKELDYQNGDKEFPKGIDMEFYDLETQKITSTLIGNHARYIKEEDKYVVTGNVIVKSIEKNEKLSTEELIWKPEKEEITSDKFVRIETPCEILTGDGMIASEDFSSYRILKPKANLFLDCE